MASFFSDTINSHRFQLFATAVLSGATVASLLLGYQALEREERVSELKNSIPREDRGQQRVRLMFEALMFKDLMLEGRLTPLS